MDDRAPLLTTEQLALIDAMYQREGLAEELLPPFRLRAQEGAGSALSHAQERLWFLQASAQDAASYNEPLLIELRGPLQVDRLRQALDAIRERHSILRSTIRSVEGVPSLHPRPATEGFPFTFIDARDRGPEGARATALAHHREHCTRVLDLAEDPLCQVTLVRVSHDTHLAVFFVHHIISDGWSMGVLLRELAELYGNPTTPLAPLALQYADYAVWERRVLTGRHLDKLKRYWQAQLLGAPQRLSLPRDAQQRGSRGERVEMALSPGLTEQVKSLSAALGHDVSLFMVLLGAYYVTLHDLGGDTDICVGTDFANRPNPQAEKLIGFFVNQLVLRCEVRSEEPFRDLVYRLRDVCQGAYEHHMLPFDRIVDLANTARESGVGPLFQAKLVLQNTPLPHLALPELELAVVPISRGTAKFELLLDLTEHEGSLKGWLEFALDMFTPATAKHICTRFETVLAEAVSAPEQSVGALKRAVHRRSRARRRERRQLLASPG